MIFVIMARMRSILCSQQPLYPETAYFQMRPGNWQALERNKSALSSRALHGTAYYGNLSL